MTRPPFDGDGPISEGSATVIGGCLGILAMVALALGVVWLIVRAR